MNNEVQFTDQQKQVLNRMWRKMKKVAKNGVKFNSWSINLRQGSNGRVCVDDTKTTCAFGALLMGQPNKIYQYGESMGKQGAPLLGIDVASSENIEIGFMASVEEKNDKGWYEVGEELRKRAETFGYYVGLHKW